MAAAGQRLTRASSRTMAPSPPFQGEAFFPDKALAQEFLEQFRLAEVDEGVPAGFRAVVHAVRPAVYFFLNPGADFQVVNVLVFKSDGPAIGVPEVGDDFPEGEDAPFLEGADVDGLVHVFRAEAQFFRTYGNGRFLRRVQRVEAGAFVPHDPVCPDELVDAPAAFRAFRRNRVRGGVRSVFLFPRSAAAAQFVSLKVGRPKGIYGQRIVFPCFMERRDFLRRESGEDGGVHAGRMDGMGNSGLFAGCRPLSEGGISNH